MEKTSPCYKGYSPTVSTQTTMGKQAFPTFPYNTWRTVNLRNKKSARQEG